MKLGTFFILALLALTQPSGMAEVDKNHGNPLSPSAHPKDAGEADLKLPPGLDLSETDLQCRKANILRGLQEANRQAGRVKEQLKNLVEREREPDTFGSRLRSLCLDAHAAAKEAERTRWYLAEQKSGDAREIKSASSLYKAAVTSKSSEEVTNICRKLVRESHQLKNPGAKEVTDELSQALDALISESSDRFFKAKGDYSQKSPDKGSFTPK